MALPEAPWLSSTTLGKVDDENYRELSIDKAQLPRPENQSGSKLCTKRLIVESMASVGINADLTDIVHAPAPPGDTRPGFASLGGRTRFHGGLTISQARATHVEDNW